MMLFPFILVAAVAAGYALNGRLRTFERLRPAWWPLAVAGLVVQAVPVPDLRGELERTVGQGLLLASYPLLLAFAARNVAVVGLPTVFVGLAMNFLVIAANGSMPVSEEAIVRAGHPRAEAIAALRSDPKHHLMIDDAVLEPLADVVALPAPFRQVVSVGDLVAYVGLAATVLAVMRGQTPGLALPAPSRTSRPLRLPRSLARQAPQPTPWA